ncbi:hypothetical protein [Pontibacter chitinilyticus]|uniref:hypothetical protein n=1 Tax=Pontibacter chitinilyticus TaxID=2674989 RepID=UPI00321C04E1
MKKHLLLIWVSLLGITAATAQQRQTHKVPQELASFFCGYWTGAGEFANGKQIAADVSFTLSLDSCWLSYHHRDKAPNTYEAQSMWGLNAQTGQFIAYVFDNFNGHRKFESDGWKDGKLILTNQESSPGRGQFFQHFIFEKLSDNTFKMSYEISKDGTAWRLVDHLVFTRTTAES